MENSKETPWIYNLRSGPLYDSESSDDDENNKLQGISEDSRLLQELDISSRKERAQYKPNPFSIAKINAIIRSNAHPTEKSPVQQASNASGSAFVKPDANVPVSNNNISLRKASLPPPITKNSNKNDTRITDASSTKSAARSDFTALSEKATHTEKPYYQQSPRSAPINAHTSTHTPASSFTNSTNGLKTPKIAPVPAYYNITTPSSKGISKQPYSHTRRINQETPSKLRESSNSSPLSRVSPLASLNIHQISQKYRRRAETDNNRTWKDEKSSAVKKITCSSHLGHESVKTGTVVTQITPVKRPNCYDFGEDTDAIWTTLPSKKQKTKSSAKSDFKGIKTSGTFRLPPNLTPTTHKSGMSATSTARVITFLPPPLHQYPKTPDNAPSKAEANLERSLSPRSSPLSIYFKFEGETSPHRFSSPFTSDPIIPDDDVEINWDANNISQRYQQVHKHVQQHKRLKNNIWELLELPSCCYVSQRSTTGRYGITQWNGPINCSPSQ